MNLYCLVFLCRFPTYSAISIIALFEPQSPNYIHQRVRDAGGDNPAAGAPCSSVKDAGNGSQQDVAPVKRQRFIEVREAEDDGRHHQGTRMSKPGFQHVLEQAPEEKLFRDGDKKEGHQQRAANLRRSRQNAVKADEAQRETQPDGDGRLEDPLARAHAKIAQVGAKIIADAFQSAHHQEGI